MLTIKKIVDQKRLITEKTTTDYRQEFSRISNLIASASTCNDWTELYRKLVRWELELEKSTDQGMSEILRAQEHEANIFFARFVAKNYLSWLNNDDENNPLLSP